MHTKRSFIYADAKRLCHLLVDGILLRLDGDRFWYERALSPRDQRLVNRSRLADVIRRNTAIGDELGDRDAAPPEGGGRAQVDLAVVEEMRQALQRLDARSAHRVRDRQDDVQRISANFDIPDDILQAHGE